MMLMFVLLFPLAVPVHAQISTPTSSEEIRETVSLPWYVGVLFFIVIAIGVTMMKKRISSETKKEFAASGACLPIIDEDSHPFQAGDDSPEKK